MKHKSDIKHNVRQAVPFFSVSDMQKSLAFYVDGLRFSIAYKWMVEEKIRWCWLELGAAAIMLQEYVKESTNYIQKNEMVGKGVSICFICEDALEIYQDLTSKGIQAYEPFVGNKMWVVELEDPDGYKLMFESYTEVPEETRYSEYQSLNK